MSSRIRFLACREVTLNLENDRVIEPTRTPKHHDARVYVFNWQARLIFDNVDTAALCTQRPLAHGPNVHLRDFTLGTRMVNLSDAQMY